MKSRDIRLPDVHRLQRHRHPRISHTEHSHRSFYLAKRHILLYRLVQRINAPQTQDALSLKERHQDCKCMSYKISKSVYSCYKRTKLAIKSKNIFSAGCKVGSNMAVCGDSLTLGASLKQPLENLQFWQLLHISAPEVP